MNGTSWHKSTTRNGRMHRIQSGSSKIGHANDPSTTLFSLIQRKQVCSRIICITDFRAATLNAMQLNYVEWSKWQHHHSTGNRFRWLRCHCLQMSSLQEGVLIDWGNVEDSPCRILRKQMDFSQKVIRQVFNSKCKNAWKPWQRSNRSRPSIIPGKTWVAFPQPKKYHCPHTCSIYSNNFTILDVFLGPWVKNKRSQNPWKGQWNHPVHH